MVIQKELLSIKTPNLKFRIENTATNIHEVVLCEVQLRMIELVGELSVVRTVKESERTLSSLFF